MKAMFKKIVSMILTATLVGSGISVMSAGAEQTEFPEEYILGDVNCDKKISLKDASLIQRAVLSIEEMSDIQYMLAYVDGSEFLSLKDAFIIQRYSLNIIDEYAVNKNGKIIGDIIYIDTDSDTESDIIATESDTETDTETSSDTTTDTATDTSTDTATDTVIDTETDTINETETETDTATDSATETDSTASDTDTADTDNKDNGYKATFNCINTYAIVYYTADSTDGVLASEEEVYARNGVTGLIDSTGEGEINFELYNYGYMIVTDISIEGEYKELLTVDVSKFRYRITGVKSDLKINVEGFYGGVIESDTESEEDTDSVEPYDILSMEEIQNMLDGNFEKGTQLGDTWKQGLRTKSESVAIESGSRTDGSKCLKLTTTSDYATFAYNSLHGLKPEHTYKLTVKAWGNISECDEHHNGIYLNVGQLSGLGAPYVDENGKSISGWGAYFDCYNNWIQKDCDVTTITVYFESTSRGLADIECVLWGKGTAYFDDMTIEEIDYDSEPRDKTRVMTENIGLVLMNKDVEGLTVEQMQDWCNDVEWSYQMMNDLMGVAPYKGDRIYLRSVDEPYMTGFQALSGNRVIKWRGDYMGPACVRYCKEGIWSDVAYHEIGHLYDFLEEYKWCYYSSEMGAEFRKLYCLLQHGEGKFMNHGWGKELAYDQLFEYTKSISGECYDKTIAVRSGTMHYDNMNYVLTRAVNAVGWDIARDTFHGFAKYYDPRYNTGRAKFEYLMMSLQRSYNKKHPEATGSEIYDTFPQGEFDYIGQLMNPTSAEGEKICKVQFIDPDGKKLWFEFVPEREGANPPVQSASEKYGAFTGWDMDITNITSDMVITAQYENYKPFGSATITTGSETIYEGEYATVKIDVPEAGTYKYNIICMNGSETIFESGYTDSNTASFMLSKAGGCVVYAKVKAADGTEYNTRKKQFNAEKAVVVYYSGYSSPNIHYKVGSGTWTTPPGVKMTANSDVSGYSFKYVIPLDANSTTVKCCFNDGNNNWDNNGEKDYSLTEGAVGVKNGVVTKL